MNRSGLFWGSLLIILGGLFLLSMLGILTVRVWSVFWPLALVLGGFWLLLSGIQRSRPHPPQQVTMQLKGVETAEIRFRHGGGSLILDSDTAPDQLLDGVFATGLNYEMEELDDDHAILTLRPRTDATRLGRKAGGIDWDVGLNGLIPMSLDIETGGGELQADLRDMQIRELRLQTGVSRCAIQLPRAAGRSVVRVEAGAASVTLMVPDGVAARIHKEIGAGNLAIDEERFPLADGINQSPDYDTAANAVEIYLTIGAGQADVR